ncbi:diguanylate cyclase domain-containing protein [Roseovarius salis]|uniref:diguanylate cyclase domain-containing protein n=1 Tax=Roseovarius salis TaxID=3376063 RepID=UPI0037C6A3F1
MPRRIRTWIFDLGERLSRLVTGPSALSLLPAMLLTAFLAGGGAWLFVAAVAGPGMLAAVTLLHSGAIRSAIVPVAMRGRGDRGSLEAALDNALVAARRSGGRTACIMLELGNYAALLDRHGGGSLQPVIDSVARRLRANLRRDDSVFYLGGGRFGIAVAAVNAPRSVREMATRIAGVAAASVPAPGGGAGMSVRHGIAVSSPNRRETGPQLAMRASADIADVTDEGPSRRRCPTIGQGRPLPDSP